MSYKRSVRLAIPVFPAILRNSLGNWALCCKWYIHEFRYRDKLVINLG